MTKAELALASELSVRSISAYENEDSTPGDDKVERLARVLGFPPSFFYRRGAAFVQPEAVSFRALSRMPAKDRDRALASAVLATEIDAWIDRAFSRPEPNIPDLHGHNPRAAALAVRAEWGLGVKPIRNMVHLLELHGVRVYSLAHSSTASLNRRNVDAVSMWWGEMPFVFLSTAATAERSRYNAAHELAHLVLHKHGGPSGQQAEKEANNFAGEFLVPGVDLRANPPPRRPGLQSIIEAKARWGVSALALVYRMHQERMLTDWEYQQLCIQIRGKYGNSEPHEGQRESSQVLTHVFRDLSRRGDGRRRIAETLAIPVAELDELVHGLALTLMTGGGGPDGKKSDRPRLQVLD